MVQNNDFVWMLIVNTKPKKSEDILTSNKEFQKYLSEADEGWRLQVVKNISGHYFKTGIS